MTLRNYNTKLSIWEKVEKTDGCWLWTGSVTSSGYGTVGYRGSVWSVHRLTYTWEYGKIPGGLQIDHVSARGCTSRLCCRPDHLEAVTPSLNMQRARSPKREQTHCIHGHEFTDENTIRKANGGRNCRECSRLRQRAARAKKRKPREPRTHCKNGHEYTEENTRRATDGSRRRCRRCSTEWAAAKRLNT